MSETADPARAQLVKIAEDRDRRITASPVREATSITSLVTWVQSQVQKVGARNRVAISPRNRPERVLTGGSRGGPYLQHKNGLRCSFEFVLKEQDGGVLVHSYCMELRAPAGHGTAPPFVRWEYRPVRKDNVDAVREPLAHLHPGHDHLRLPSPVHTVKELITVFTQMDLWS